MFTSRQGLGPASDRVQQQADGPSAQLRFPLSAAQRPLFASITDSFGHVFQNLLWDQGQRSTASGSGAGIGAQTEPKTNTFFEERFCQRGNSRCGSLAGVGVRSKKIAGVKTINVYALGLYVDVPAAKGTLRSYRSKPPETLVKDQAFYDALIKADHVEKTLHMSISFGHISSSQFWEAIREQLAAPMARAGAHEDLQQFARIFEGVKFRKGLPLSFCMSKGGLLTSKIDGKDASTIRSRPLCESLLGVYLGKDAVSPDAKESIGSGLAAMLAD